MSSISSKSLIIKRTLEFFTQDKIDILFSEKNNDYERIIQFLEREYDLIPEREKIGKGSVYIAKNVANGIIKNVYNLSEHILFNFSTNVYEYAKIEKNRKLVDFALSFLGEISCLSNELFEQALQRAKMLANESEWETREMSVYSIKKGLRFFPEKTISILREWVIQESNPNVRRFIAESLRPSGDIKWLRNPNKNNNVLEILQMLKAEPSEYVRKAVGNNLKDLSKYMPEKILKLTRKWVKEANIIVDNELASRSKKELDEQQFYLIWTIKQALRWLKNRNPEYYPQIQDILGKNYIVYFDEKKNRTAKPK